MTELPKVPPRTIFVVVLLVAVFAAAIIDVVIPITILDVSNTFSVLPGTVATLDSIIAIASVVTALLLGAFGGRFRYKSVVILGVLLIAACAVGFFLAPTFLFVQLIVPLNGIGSVLIVVTAQTFIGNSYPLDKKAKAIGWVAAAGTLANAIGAPIIGFMTGLAGWRSVFLLVMLPLALFSLIFVLLVFPLNSPQEHMKAQKRNFMEGFKKVFGNKSAVACLLTAFFGFAFVFGGAVLEVTFLRQVFMLSPGFAALIGTLAGTALISVGAVIGGYLVNRFGRKRLTVLAVFLGGFFTATSYLIPNLSLFLALNWTGSVFIGVMAAAASNLTLEQVPEFRGTIMSLSSAFSGVGTAVGIAIAGAVVNLYGDPVFGFQMLGLTVGVLAVSAGLINALFAKDPLRQSFNQNLSGSN